MEIFAQTQENIFLFRVQEIGIDQKKNLIYKILLTCWLLNKAYTRKFAMRRCL